MSNTRIISAAWTFLTITKQLNWPRLLSAALVYFLCVMSQLVKEDSCSLVSTHAAIILSQTQEQRNVIGWIPVTILVKDHIKNKTYKHTQTQVFKNVMWLFNWVAIVCGGNQSQQLDFSDTGMPAKSLQTFYARQLRTGSFSPKLYRSEGTCRVINHQRRLWCKSTGWLVLCYGLHYQKQLHCILLIIFIKQVGQDRLIWPTNYI